jgi:hypothetical protein
MKWGIRSGSTFLLLVAAAMAQQPDPAAGWWKHVSVLADDSMEGRETGTPGYRRAAAYVVGELKGIGLRPGNGKSYYQTVRFRKRLVDESRSSLELVRNGATEPLKLGDDAYFDARVALQPAMDAELVFVGYGLQIPEVGYDDLAGLDLRGKIAVQVSGAPADLPPNLSSFYQFPGERWRGLRRAGAVGVISIPNPAGMDQPWSRMALNRFHPSMVLADPALDETPGEALALVFNPASAAKLLDGSGHDWEEIIALAQARKPLPHFALAVKLRARARVEESLLNSDNVVALLPGLDPRLRDEVVILSAHLDHLGIGEPVNGDRIYNGAIDNAAGVAIVLETAKLLAHGAPPKRSVLFALFTGEEKNELGSKYMAAHPTVKGPIVADLNIDMFKPIVPLNVLDVYGVDESGVGDAAREAGAALGVKVEGDPEPLRNRFIRSDQFSFVRRGIPAVNMHIGAERGSADDATLHQWLRERYHAPSDDLNQPVNHEAAAKYNRIVEMMITSMANAPERPAWKPQSFFRRFAGAASTASSGR